MSTILTGTPPSLVVTSNILSPAGNNSVRPTTIEVQQAAASPPQPSEAQQLLQHFWQNQLQEVQHVTSNDFKVQDLPLARIKKIMKMDDDVKMISAEAPLLFAKAAQMFVTELSLRAWIHTEENKRRTLQRNDIATAITKFDQFDFLIDIVPREELKPTRRPEEVRASTTAENVQYFYSLPNQAQQTVVQTQPTPVSSSVASSTPAGQILLTQSGGQILQLSQNGQLVSVDGNQQIIQIPQQQITQPQTQQVTGTTTANVGGSLVVGGPQGFQQAATTGGAIVLGGNSQQLGTILNAQTETSQQNRQQNNVIQQFLTNSNNSLGGEMHSLQLGPDGQLQLVKTVDVSQGQA